MKAWKLATVAGRPLTIYAVHFKSMGGARNGLDGRGNRGFGQKPHHEGCNGDAELCSGELCRQISERVEYPAGTRIACLSLGFDCPSVNRDQAELSGYKRTVQGYEQSNTQQS
jgi:hypothetical protein